MSASICGEWPQGGDRLLLSGALYQSGDDGLSLRVGRLLMSVGDHVPVAVARPFVPHRPVDPKDVGLRTLPHTLGRACIRREERLGTGVPAVFHGSGRPSWRMSNCRRVLIW